jgi:hypothetical protein
MPAGLVSEPPQKLLALQRDAGHTAKTNDIEGDLALFELGRRLLEGGLAVLVVPVGNEHHCLSPCGSGHHAGRLTNGVENGRPPGVTDCTDGLEYGRPIRGRSRHGGDRA